MDLTQLYDNYYASERENEWYEVNADDKARNAIALCEHLAARSIVDIGAGPGAVLRRIAAAGMGEELHAVEISKSGIHELRKLAAEFKDGRIREPRQLTSLRLPYDDDQFDLAILSHVVEHVEHPRTLLHEVRRIARHVYVEVPLEVVSLRNNLRGDWKLDTTGHINYYDRHLIRRLMQTSGWKVLKERVTTPHAEVYKFVKGKRGLVEHRIKKLFLAASPALAQALFTFHCGLLCERGEILSLGLDPPPTETPPAP